MADEDKTEEATPNKMSEAREKGDVPHSREFASFVLFTGLCSAIYFSVHRLLNHGIYLLKTYFDFKAFKLETKADLVVFTNGAVKELLLCFISHLQAELRNC